MTHDYTDSQWHVVMRYNNNNNNNGFV